MTLNQALYARSELKFISTFCMRQYCIVLVADYYTWFPNMVAKMVGDE